MSTYRRFIWWLRMWGSPDLDFREDYETLVRLARRCAYDLRHASDEFGPDDYFQWRARANSWVSLFAKGNPGKDYRHKIQRELEQAERDAQCLLALCREHGIDVPDEVADRVGGLPF